MLCLSIASNKFTGRSAVLWGSFFLLYQAWGSVPCNGLRELQLGRFYSGFCARITPVFLTLPVKKKRLAASSVSIPRIASPELSVLMSFCGHPPPSVHLSVLRFLFRRRGNGGWRRNALFFIAYLFGFGMLSAGSTMGLRAPNPRQRAIGSLDSPHAAAG